MAVVIIQTNDGTEVSRIVVTNAEGPWTDAGTVIDEIAWDINDALKAEGDEA